MIVAVVAHELTGEPTGVGRYLAGLLSGVAQVDPGWRWRLLFPGERFDHPLFALPGMEPVFAGWTGRALAWEQTRLPGLVARLRPDLVYSPSYSLAPEVPGAGVPGVVTVHDLSFEVLPEEFGWRERWRRRLLARTACRRAARVLAIREGMRRELIEAYGLVPGEVGVVLPGVGGEKSWVGRKKAGAGVAGGAATPMDEEGGAVLAGLGVRPPYLLHLGTLLDRRRIDVVLAAFAALRARFPEMALVLAGADRLRDRGELARRLADPRLAGGVVRLGYVPEAAVGPLYRGAELSVYLSSYEGFGLPPLESLAAGTPPVVSAGLGLDDLWPDYPYRCRSLEAGEVARTLEAAFAYPASRAAVAAEGERRAAEWTWRAAGERFLAELERARGGNG